MAIKRVVEIRSKALHVVVGRFQRAFYSRLTGLPELASRLPGFCGGHGLDAAGIISYKGEGYKRRLRDHQ